MKKIFSFLLIFVLAAVVNPIAADTQIDEAPILGIENRVIFSDVSDPIYTEEVTDQITAIDDVDGDLTENIYIIMNQYLGNEETLGEYSITYAVRDSINQIARLNVKIRVVDITPPEILGLQDFVIDINETPIDFASYFTASDNYDGDVTVFITVEDDAVKYNQYGKYPVYISVYDTSSNSTIETIYVTVKDLVPPSIDGYSTIVKSTNDLVTAQDLLLTLTAEDNIDGNLSNEIVILEDNYTGNGDKVGHYSITYRVIDSAGNSSDHVIDIEVRNDIPDILYIDNIMLELGKDEIITDSDIEWLLTSTGELDPYSDYYLEVLKDEYSGNETTAGVYDYFVKFTSNTGEEVQKNLILRVMYTIEQQHFEGQERPNWFINNMAWLIPSTIVSISGTVLLFKFLFNKKG